MIVAGAAPINGLCDRAAAGTRRAGPSYIRSLTEALGVPAQCSGTPRRPLASAGGRARLPRVQAGRQALRPCGATRFGRSACRPRCGVRVHPAGPATSPHTLRIKQAEKEEEAKRRARRAAGGVENASARHRSRLSRERAGAAPAPAVRQVDRPCATWSAVLLCARMLKIA